MDNEQVPMVALPPRYALVPNAVAFRDPQHGIMGTGWQSCAGSAFGCKPQGAISITSNGGKTWTVLFRTPRPVVAVSLQGTREQARFDDGETIGSSDGGLHWAPVVAGYAPVFAGPCPAFTSEFVSGDWAVCATQSSAGNQGKYVYRLRATGWKRIAATPFAPPAGKTYGGISTYGYVQGIAMASDGFGVIWESRGTLYVTRDGGRDWTGLPKVAQPEVDFGMAAVALRGGVGFVILAIGGTEKRRLIETTDAGRTWRTVHSWN